MINSEEVLSQEESQPEETAEPVAAPEFPFGEKGSTIRNHAIKRLGRILELIQGGGRIYGRRGYMERSLPEENLFWLYRAAEYFLTGECSTWVDYETNCLYRKANIAGDSPTDEETAWMNDWDSRRPLPDTDPEPEPEPEFDPMDPLGVEAFKNLGFWQKLKWFLTS